MAQNVRMKTSGTQSVLVKPNDLKVRNLKNLEE
jgi:hypothetical protein